MGVSARREELSRLNLLFCAMVLYSHTASYLLSALPVGSRQHLALALVQRVSFVSIYGFFLLSGVKLTLSGRWMGALPYYARRAKTVLLPYAVAALLCYLYLCRLPGQIAQPSAGDFLLRLVRGDVMTPFWFVVALAQFLLLAPLLRRLAERVSPVFALPVALGVNWCSESFLELFCQLFKPDLVLTHVDRIFTNYIFFYLAGCYIGMHYDAFCALLRKNRRFLLSAALLFAAADLALTCRAYVGTGWSPLWPWAQRMHVLCAVPACLLLALSCERPLPRWLRGVDCASFSIYLYHGLVLAVVQEQLAKWGVDSLSLIFILRLIAAYILTPLLCCLAQAIRAAIPQKLTKETTR